MQPNRQDGNAELRLWLARTSEAWPRPVHRALCVARTIAALAGAEGVSVLPLMEVLQYRVYEAQWQVV